MTNRPTPSVAPSQAGNAGGNDTIVALASAPGRAGVAVVRLSGPGALAVLATVFVPRHAAGQPMPPRRMVLGTCVHGSGEAFDEALAVVFPGPRSFTGEDVAELHLHGGPGVVAAALSACVAAGARPAMPGEYTRRAFENGRIDLTRAEAVADLASAQTLAAAAAAVRGLQGATGTAAEAAYDEIIAAAALIEAYIDFPDEDLPQQDAAQIDQRLARAVAALDALLAGARRGQLLRDGARAVLVGRPNAGKSSLLNCLAGSDRAIVSPHPGTTRDTIEAVVDIAGVAVTLVDTAGLRETDDPVEQMGVERSRRAILGADLLIHVMDGTRPGADDDELITAGASGSVPMLRVLTRRDAAEFDATYGLAMEPHAEQLAVSCVTGQGISELEQALARVLGAEASGGEALLSRQRQVAAVSAARAAVAAARGAALAGLPGELVMVDLREALDQLDALLGRQSSEAVLDQLFSGFCIGK